MKTIDGLVPPENQRYKCSAEYLIWSGVPASSIVKTIPMSQLLDLVIECASVDKILQLHVMASFSRLREARSTFASNIIYLDGTTAIGFARILHLLSITPISPTPFIHSATYVLIDGWVIDVQKPHCIEEAFDIRVFQYYKSSGAQDSIDLSDAKAAFQKGILDGLNWKKSTQNCVRKLQLSREEQDVNTEETMDMEC